MGLLPLLAMALVQMDEKPTAIVKLAASSVAVGKPLKGTLTLTLPSGLHGYQNPPADEYETPIKLSVMEAGVKLGKVDYPKGVEMKMEGAEKPSMVYEGTISIPFTLVVSKPMPKLSSVGIKVDYQLCNATSCFPPSSITAKAPLKLAPAAVKPKAAKKP